MNSNFNRCCVLNVKAFSGVLGPGTGGDRLEIQRKSTCMEI